jgi:hypothetical protein
MRSVTAYICMPLEGSQRIPSSHATPLNALTCLQMVQLVREPDNVYDRWCARFSLASLNPHHHVGVSAVFTPVS